MCPACARIVGAVAVCTACRTSLAAAPDRVVGGVLVRAAFLHEGAARRLIHRLKYQALGTAVIPFVERLAAIVAATGDRPPALVPVPRSRVRHGTYGVDPARLIAVELGARIAVPVVDALRPGWWWPRHALGGRQRRPPRFFVRTHDVPPGAALVDDVVTTGVTLAEAARLVRGASLAYAATSVQMSGTAKGSTDSSRIRVDD